MSGAACFPGLGCWSVWLSFWSSTHSHNDTPISFFSISLSLQGRSESAIQLWEAFKLKSSEEGETFVTGVGAKSGTRAYQPQERAVGRKLIWAKRNFNCWGFLFCFRKEYKLKYKLPIFKMHSLTKVLIYGHVRWKRTLHAEGVWCPLASPPSCSTHPQTTTDLLSLTANDFALPSFG